MDVKSSKAAPAGRALTDQKREAADLVRWFETDGRPFIESHAPEQLAAFDNDCLRLTKLIETPENITACFLGHSGIGKSTLLNALAAYPDEGHQRAHAAVFEVLDAGRENVLTKDLDPGAIKKIARNWKLREEDARLLLRDVLPRLDLDAETMEAIASNERAGCGLSVSGQEIAANPYLIAEMYCGSDASERIPWSTVDRGVLPSPNLGGKPLAEVEYNDERRFRALCVEHLRRDLPHLAPNV